MHTLILQRHAKAVRDHEAPSDRARALTERGREDAAEAGRQLARFGLGAADAALVSPAERTRQTAEIAGAIYPPGETRFLEALYLADARAIFALAVESGADTVWVVGHNPGLHDLVRVLLEAAQDHSKLARVLAEHVPTAAFAAFDLSGETFEAPGPRLLAAWTP
jgi:phosphohistidine phosphatase